MADSGATKPEAGDAKTPPKAGAEKSSGRVLHLNRSGPPNADAALGDGWFSEAVATFGDRLAGAREAAGLSQEALAGRLGVRKATLRAWEDDLAEPRGNRLQLLSSMLNVSLAWLMTGEGLGLDAPVECPAPAADARQVTARDAIAELAALRIRATELAEDALRVEKRLREVLRQEMM